MIDVVLDTSAYSQMRRGHEEALDRLSRAQIVYLPATVVGELRAGFELGSRARENQEVLRQFLDEPFVQVIATDLAVAARYGKVFADLRRAGTPIPINDVWIAAAALERGAAVLTFDDDFLAVTGLEVELLRATRA